MSSATDFAVPVDYPLLTDEFSMDGVGELARLIALALRDGVVIQNEDGEIVWFNPVACRLLRMTPDQLRGRSSLDPQWESIRADGTPYPGQDHPSMRAMATGSPVRNALMGVRGGDLQLRWLSIDSVPVVVDDRRVSVTVFTDVTNEREDRLALERSLAEMQALLLQDRLPDNDMLRMAARYRSVGLSTTLGGDFYGGYECTDRRVAMFIGDVCGHGIGSASLSSLARNTMRAVSLVVDNPSLVLRELHRVVLLDRPDTFLTTLCAYVEQTPSSLLFRVAIGGHPQPILVRDGHASHIGVSGSLVGMLPDSPRPVFECELRPGDRVVAYTDGLMDCATPRLSSDEILGEVPTHGDIDDILDTLMRLGSASPTAPDDAALIGFEVH